MPPPVGKCVVDGIALLPDHSGMAARIRKYVQTGDPDTATPLTKEDREDQRIAESAQAAAAKTLKRLPPVQPSAEQIVGLRAIFSNPPPPSQLMRWRLRLYCGHVTERTCHVDRLDARSAFLSEACEECGLDPAVVVAAKPLGLESDLAAAEAKESPSAHPTTAKT